ncbi:Hsp20/alpha crystallin family protein [Deinococcus pimensis]|uniref:Hsp20/alpha crystallin family protein n=1 Tax=Deinococcus pimensis TaxID=309888 RepID=UPI0004828AF2|nr:Hsp20/alpha crystallin family protein [Deinococcus pimensis]
MNSGNEPVLRRINTLMQLRQQVESLDGRTPWVPSVDWIETDTELHLVVDAPGVEPDAFELLEEGERVTISGTRPPLDFGGTVLTAERPHGQFQRVLGLPVETLPGTGRAQMRAGVLVVTFEKKHKIIDHE